jgi:hypothetical protein
MYIYICMYVHRECPKFGVPTNYLLPYRGCLNVHEKNIEKTFQTKKSIIVIMYYSVLTVMQSKQRYTRTSLPCNVTAVDL